MLFFACGIWCLADILSGVCSDKGLTLETSSKHHIPQAKNILYQPFLVIKSSFHIYDHS